MDGSPTRCLFGRAPLRRPGSYSKSRAEKGGYAHALDHLDYSLVPCVRSAKEPQEITTSVTEMVILIKKHRRSAGSPSVPLGSAANPPILFAQDGSSSSIVMPYRPRKCKADTDIHLTPRTTVPIEAETPTKKIDNTLPPRSSTTTSCNR